MVPDWSFAPLPSTSRTYVYESKEPTALAETSKAGEAMGSPYIPEKIALSGVGWASDSRAAARSPAWRGQI